MTNNDKKLLIMGIILLMKGNKRIIKFLDEMETLMQREHYWIYFGIYLRKYS